MWVWNATAWSQKLHVKDPPTFHLGVTEVTGPVSGKGAGTFTRLSKQKIYKQRNTPSYASFTNINQDLSFQLQKNTSEPATNSSNHVDEELRASYRISYRIVTETYWWEF